MLVIKSIIALLYLFTLSSTSFAAPVPHPDAATWDGVDLVARTAVPTVAEIKGHLNVAKDTSLFYSASNGQPPEGSAKHARDWAKTKKNGYKILAQLWKDSNYQNAWQNHADKSKAFFDNASEAMAEMSSGTVYVMLPPSKDAHGKDWWSGSVWARKEWPALERNHAVTKVIRVDPAGKEIKIKG